MEKTTAAPRRAALDLGAGPGPVALMGAASLEPARMSAEALLDAIGEVERSASWVASVRAEFIAEYASREVTDPRNGVEQQAMDWHREQLAAVCRTSPWEAHVRSETALALAHRLPATAALRAGSLPWAQAVALARESDGLDAADSTAVERAVLADPRAVSVRQVTRATQVAVEGIRPDSAVEVARSAQERRRLVFWPARDGSVAMLADLPVEAAALVAAALEPFAVRAGVGDDRDVEQRRADALVELATGATRPRVVLTLLARTGTGTPSSRRAGQAAREPGAQAVSGERPGNGQRRTGHVGDGPIGGGEVSGGLMGGGPMGGGQVSGGLVREPVSIQTVRRLARDADVAVRPVDTVGSVGSVGSVGLADPGRRAPGAELRRTLELRDQGCRFPACPTGAARCHAHHLRHWADGGPTTETNLVLICSRHHHAVHEGGWRLAGPPSDLIWTDRNGRRYEQPPPTATIAAWDVDPPMIPTPDPDPEAAPAPGSAPGRGIRAGLKSTPEAVPWLPSGPLPETDERPPF